MKVGIFGAGYSGRRIGEKLINSGAQVWGTGRDGDNFDGLQSRDICPVLFDGKILSNKLLEMLQETSHLIVSIAPSSEAETNQAADPIIAALNDRKLKSLAPKLEWIGYLSTVGVYGNHDGNWVDETNPVAPLSNRSKQRVRAENEWLELGESLNLPIGFFRLAGIYGPGRNALLNANQGKSRRMVKKGQVFNRIHVEDIASALMLAAQLKAPGIFNITDDEPAPPQDVVSFAHELTGSEPPEEIDFQTADISPMARSFYGENKRVYNSLSKKILKLDYTFPNYRVALRHMWKHDTWRG